MGSLHVYDEFRGHKASQNTHGDIAHLPLGPCAQPVANQTTFVWLQTVLAHAGSRSQEALIKLLRGRKSHPDKTASVLNQARSLIAKVFPFVAPNKPNAGDSLRKASACEQLFKLCLHRVLLLALDEAASLQGVSSPADLGEAIFFAAVASVLSKNEVLDGLAQGCIEIVVFAHLTSPQDSFPAASMRMGRSTQWVELLQGLVWVRHSKLAIQGATLEEGTIPGLPEFPPELDAYIATMECRIVEELAFVPGSTFYQRVKELGPCSNARDTPAVPNEVQGPNALMVKNVIRRVGRLAQERTTTLCMALCQASGVAGLPAGVKVENGFLKATCALAKLHKIRVRWATLTKAATTLLAQHDNSTLEEVPLTGLLSVKWETKGEYTDISDSSDDEWNSEEEEEEEEEVAAVGSAKEFYNRVLVPLVGLYQKKSELSHLFGATSAALEAAVDAAGGDVILDESAIRTGNVLLSQGTPSGASPDAAGGRRRAGKPASVRKPLAALANNRKNAPARTLAHSDR